MEAHLNMSALSDPNALIPLVSALPYNLENIHALVDSRSTHCFVDIQFTHQNKITTHTISPVTLWLFDGLMNFVITQAVDLSILFPATGDVTPMNFYLAPLDSECKIVLGHNWLTHFNPLIDWVLSSIKFWTFAGSLPAPPLTPSPDLPRKSVPGLPNQSDPGLVPSVNVPVCTLPHVSLVNAVAFAHACKLEGFVKYQLRLFPSSEVKGQSSSTSPAPDLSFVPLEYRNYADVFSKVKASELPLHCDYDLKIDLEKGTSPPLGTLYSLSPVKLSTLQTFIDENLGTRFICPTASSHAALVLFIKKRTVPSGSALTLEASIKLPKRITTHSC